MNTPQFLKTAYTYWMKFVYVLGEINGFIIFTVFFYVVLAPYAIVQKLISASKKSPQNPHTFWEDKKYIEPTIENISRQF